MEEGSSTLRRLCEAALDGDEVAPYAVLDCALEEGIEGMQSVKIGHRVMVKTHTHYYRGTVVASNLMEIVLDGSVSKGALPLPGVFEVYDIGSLTECYEQGRINSEEKLPDWATVSIPISSVNVVISMEKPAA